MSQMTIGEVASRAGIRPSAIRFYEREGLLPAPPRIHGHRRYEPDVLQAIRVIQVAQKAGFTVGEIRTLLHEFPADRPPSARWKNLAGQKLEEIILLQARVNAMKMFLEKALECQCASINDCASGLNAADNDSEVQRLDGSPIHSVDQLTR